jgi:hypothetical protein
LDGIAALILQLSLISYQDLRWNCCLSSSSMSMAFSDPLIPSLAAQITRRISLGVKCADPSFKNWIGWYL